MLHKSRLERDSSRAPVVEEWTMGALCVAFSHSEEDSEVETKEFDGKDDSDHKNCRQALSTIAVVQFCHHHLCIQLDVTDPTNE